MNKHFIEYDGIKTWFRKMKFDKRNPLTIYPICKKEFIENDEIYLLINNHELFPNCVIHSNCYAEGNPNNTIKFLIDDFNKAKEYLKEIKCWFNYEKVCEEAYTEIYDSFGNRL